MSRDRSNEGCSKCSKNLPIVNKHFWLCQECNNVRLKGETLAETAVRQHNKWQNNYQEKNQGKQKGIRQQTAKQAKTDKLLSDVKKEIELDAIQEGMYFCWGCGHSKPGLDKSHILSIRDRKDLELDKENINLFCRTCHDKWESRNIELILELDCFEKDLIYIQKNDPLRYNQLLTKVKEFVDFSSKLNILQFKEETILLARRIAQQYDYCEVERGIVIVQK